MADFKPVFSSATEQAGIKIGLGLFAIAQALDNMAIVTQETVNLTKKMYEEQKGAL